ncbi:hypothetical protein [Sphingobacterium endophyticum]|uniref:hypothetical protein n=1 Tax=Sphingobacterium endophyticum TaxID=2546448 RepID=UPI0012E2453E|nr:hypothetical protein [Sphingobacterium endophyticum]
MDELDILKQHWKKDQNFPKVNKEEIRRMLYKSSSSLVKWIFIISVIELFVGLLINFLAYKYDIFEKEENNPFEIFTNIIDVISYLVIFYFIYAFFTSYKKIKTTNNTKDLLSDILFTRKTVGNYIKFNIYMIIFSIGISTVQLVWEEDIINKSVGHNIMFFTLLCIVMFLVGWLTISLIKLYYRVIYIRLVKKLDQNYEDLVKLDQEENAINI